MDISGQLDFLLREKKTGVKCLHWLHINLLLVLLAGQASCNHTSAAPSTPFFATTTAQTSAAHYFVDVTVDVSGKKNESEIIAWLSHAFQNHLESCGSQTEEETTATTTSPQMTSASTNETTTTLESYNTTTAMETTTLQSYNTTTAATSTTLKTNNTAARSTALETNNTAARSTALETNNTTTVATSKTLKTNNTTTAATSTALKTNNTTTATTSTALKTNNTTTAATSTALKTNNTAATSTALETNNTTTAPTSTAATQISGIVTQSSWISNDTLTGLFQGIEVSCAMKTAIQNTSCSVILKLNRTIPSCCVLRTLCAASKNSADIHAVGRKASQLQHECYDGQQRGNICTYTGPANTSCEQSGPAYVVPPSNSTVCGAEKQINCSCSAYCNGTDAYYTFWISTHDPKINTSYVLSLVSALSDLPNCSSGTNVSCPSDIIKSEYKDANVTCRSTAAKVQLCKVILGFADVVPSCTLAFALMNVFQPEKQIGYNGRVTRAAICGNSKVNDSLIHSVFTWSAVNLNPAAICKTKQGTNIRTAYPHCQNGTNVLVHLQQGCVVTSGITPDATVTTTPSTSTTASVNGTLSPQNTTAGALNTTITTTTVNVTMMTTLNTTTATTKQPVNTTAGALNTTTTNITTTTTATAAANVTMMTTLNTTTATTKQPVSVNTTAGATNTNTTTTATAANVTVRTTLHTTAATKNESVFVTPSESPTTTATADSQANALLDLTGDVSRLNSSQVDQLVSQLESLLSGPTVSLSLGNTSIHIVSNLLGASPQTLSDSSNRIIGIVDTVALKLVLQGKAETLLSPAVALSVKPADGTNFQETFFSISDPSDVQVRGDPRLRRSIRTDSSTPQGSIRLPPSLTQDLTSGEQQQVSRVQFNFYQKSTVFQDRSLGQRKLNSGILGASVANLSITGLQDDIVIHLRNTEPVPGNFVAKCVFWDFTLNDGSGGWNGNGCIVRNSTDNETVCGCNHLTSFAILLDLSREPLTSRLQATILSFITYIGCGVSAIFLSVTLLTYLAFGKLRKDIPSKILIQLCLALLLLNLVFLVDAWLALYPEAVGLCISTAWFLHYFLLVAFTWMGLEAVHMYLALVKVFNSYVSRYMLKFSLVGWGVPMIVVIIVIAIDKDNYGLVSYAKYSDGTTDGFCWLKNDIAFYVAVVAYFCVIFLFNFIIFIVVLVQLCRIKRQNPHNVLHRTTLQDARSVAGITILLGLTWGFAFFAWGPVNLAFMYLFAICNSLQGFFIFVFHCAVKENVRKQWRTYLCCGRMRLAENSEWSRTATQKTTRRLSVTRLTSLHSSNSSKSNNSSSSSSFLVSDPPELISGIGSPFEDRTITADEHSRDVILNEINMQYRNQQVS